MSATVHGGLFVFATLLPHGCNHTVAARMERKMPKIAKPFTDYAIKTFKPSRSQKGWREISDGGCRGLLIKISPRGEKVWVTRQTINGNRVYHTLGGYPAVSLSDARRRAGDYISHARDGSSPKETDARIRAETLTIVDANALYIKAMESSLAKNTIASKRAMFRDHILPVAGKRLIRKIRRADVVEIVETVKSKGMKVQANRVFSEFMAMLRWAEQSDYIDGVPSFNKFKSKEQPRRRTLTGKELGTVWSTSRDIGRLSGDFIRLLILSGQRRDDVRLMRWDEIDMKSHLWTIPAIRYKTRIAQVVPLNTQMMDVLLTRWKRGVIGFVLAGENNEKPFNGASGALRRLRTKTKIAENFTLHDFRRTCRSQLPRLGVDDATAELVIGHAKQGMIKVYDQYDRIDERTDALERWGAYVISVAGECSDNVIPISSGQ
jgi:integrase